MSGCNRAETCKIKAKIRPVLPVGAQFDTGLNLTYNGGKILNFIIKNMPERTSAFESYLKDLENKKVVAPKGRVAREGRLTVAVDELSEKSDDEPEVDIAV